MEILGEIKHFYPEKKLGVIQRPMNLLSNFTENTQNIVMNWAREKNINLHTGETYQPGKEKELGYDMVIMSIGATYSSDYMRANFHECLSSKGQIFVNDFLQVTNQNPLSSQREDSQVYNNIFSLGDVNLSRLNEEKAIIPLKFSVDILGNNILCMANDRFDRLQTLPRQFPGVYSLTLGPNDGIMVLNSFSTRTGQASQMKLELMQNNTLAFGGNQAAINSQMTPIKQLKCMLGCFKYTMCCCPCAKIPRNEKI